MPLAYKPPIFSSQPSSPVVLDYGFTNTWTTWGVMHFIWTQIQLCGGLVSHRSLKAISGGKWRMSFDPADGSRDCTVWCLYCGPKYTLTRPKKDETEVKIRGLTLDRCGRHHLHYDGMRRTMLAEAHEPLAEPRTYIISSCRTRLWKCWPPSTEIKIKLVYE